MEFKQKITYLLGIFLFIIIFYYIYYSIILTIISNNCNPIMGGLIRGNTSFIIDFINFYERGENYICKGYINILKNSNLTLMICILFLWVTIIPLIIKRFELKLKYKNLFFILGIVTIVLFIIFFIINTHYLKYGFPTVEF